MHMHMHTYKYTYACAYTHRHIERTRNSSVFFYPALMEAFAKEHCLAPMWHSPKSSAFRCLEIHELFPIISFGKHPSLRSSWSCWPLDPEDQVDYWYPETHDSCWSNSPMPRKSCILLRLLQSVVVLIMLLLWKGQSDYLSTSPLTVSHPSILCMLQGKPLSQVGGARSGRQYWLLFSWLDSDTERKVRGQTNFGPCHCSILQEIMPFAPAVPQGLAWTTGLRHPWGLLTVKALSSQLNQIILSDSLTEFLVMVQGTQHFQLHGWLKVS